MNNFKKGFTLVELLVVVAIIGILAAIVFVALNDARFKGVDAIVKADLVNAMKQAEIFYNTNTASPNSYQNVCNNPGPVGTAKTIAAQVEGAAKAYGLVTYSINVAGTATTATCNENSTAWVAEVPLKTIIPAPNQMWCVDSTGKSLQVTGSSITGAADKAC